jgi:hypothetical protein
MQTLGKIRAVALRRPMTQGSALRIPIVQIMHSPRSGFFPLADTPREFVFGLAGKPWSNEAVRLEAAGFRRWSTPGNIKVAANFLIQDLGNGTSRVITETRVQATDEAARHKMAKYWALIYPGSGMIRRSLLEAVRERSERL